MTTGWTTAADIRARVRRRWDDGTLLRSYAAGEHFPGFDLPVKGPRPAQIGDQLDAVRSWMEGLDAGRRGDRHYTLVFGDVGGRHIGRNRVPVRAVLGSYDQAWALLGVGAEVRQFEQVLAVTAGESRAQAWVHRHPMRALRVAADWPALVAAYQWLTDARGSGQYLRQISAPGVDTKFVEGHRGILAQLLGVSGSAAGFVADLGLATKPEMVRLRVDPTVGLTGGFSEATLLLDELAAAVPAAPIRIAVIVENEITYLSVPVPDQGVVLWGRGFDLGRLDRLAWLGPAQVYYWGDVDTHGFAILNRLRAHLPQARSLLMDSATLHTHRERWGQEPAPTSARLERLNGPEAGLYDDLVSDRWGERVRLEQERIDWGWVLERFPS